MSPVDAYVWTTVPNVVGQAQVTAEANLVSTQLIVGTVTTAYDLVVPAGDVISQSVTAGNSSQMSDGAGALLLVNEETLKRYNMTPIAKYHAFSVAGVPADIMGIGPIKAIPKVLGLAGLKSQDMDWIELN